MKPTLSSMLKAPKGQVQSHRCNRSSANPLHTDVGYEVYDIVTHRRIKAVRIKPNTINIIGINYFSYSGGDRDQAIADAIEWCKHG